jgi:hypothetical protein
MTIGNGKRPHDPSQLAKWIVGMLLLSQGARLERRSSDESFDR